MHWTARLCDQISRTLRLPVFWQVFLPVLLVLGLSIPAVQSFVHREREKAVNAIVEHETVDLKDEVESSCRQLLEVYSGLRDAADDLAAATSEEAVRRLAGPYDNDVTRQRGVPCVFAAVLPDGGREFTPTTWQPLSQWVDAQSGWQLASPDDSTGLRLLLNDLRQSPQHRLLMSPPEHVMLRAIAEPEGQLELHAHGAVVWLAAVIAANSSEPSTKPAQVVVAAFDLRQVLGHFFYSPRHISWLRTPIGSVHATEVSAFRTIFSDPQLDKWQELASQEGGRNPVYRELPQHTAVVGEKGELLTGAAEYWYSQSELISETSAHEIPRDAWRKWQASHCAPGEIVSPPNATLQRVRVSATSLKRLTDHQDSIAQFLRDRGSAPPQDWEDPLALLGPEASRQGCVIQYVSLDPPEFVLPRQSWDFAVGMFKREVGQDAVLEIQNRYNWELAAILAGLVGTGVLIWLMTDSIRRIKDAAYAISAKAESNSPDWLDELPTLPVDRRDEVGDLARAFASMVAAIGSRDTALRDEHRRSQAILENAADGILTVDHTHAILNYNRAAERLFRWEKQSARGRPIEDMVANPANVQLDELSPSESGIFGRRLSNIIAVRADGTYFPMDLTISQVPLENESIELLIVRDVTEREESSQRLHELLAELESAKQELEERVELRTKQLEDAKDAVDRRNEELIKVNRIHSVGLHSIAHELVAPVTNIDAQCRTMLDFLSSQSREDQEAHLREVASSISNIGELITILRDAARCQRGEIQLDRQRIRLKTLIEQSIGLLQLDISKRGQRINWRPEFADFDLFVDSARCKLVLKNLISNASKYSPSDSEILIEVFRSDDAAVIAISDHGMGVPEADRTRVFEEFHRASNAKDKVQGLGLGLSLARRFLELHNGTISLESREGQGSTFSVRLPLGPGCERTAACATPDRSTSRPDWHDRRIALIDQYPERLAALSDLLQAWHLAIMPDGTTARLIAELSGGVFVPEVVFAGDDDVDDVRAALADCSGDQRPRLIWLTTIEPQHAVGIAESQGYDGFLQATLPLAREAVCAVLDSVLGVVTQVSHHH